MKSLIIIMKNNIYKYLKNNALPVRTDFFSQIYHE